MTKNLGGLLESTILPEKVALIDYKSYLGADRRVFTYRDLDQCAQRLTKAFVEKLFLKKNDRVAIIAENSAEYILTYIALLRAGLQPVLINYKLSTERIAKILNHSEAKLIFCDFNKTRDGLEKSALKEIVFESEEFLSLANYQKSLSNLERIIVDVDENEPAFLLYTSGSTSDGLKAAVISHQNHFSIINRSDGRSFKKYLNWIQSDKFKLITASPMFHLAGLANVEAILYRKGTVVLLPRFETKTFLKAIDENKVTAIRAVPPMLAMALAEKELINKYDMSSVQLISLGSAPLSSSLIEKIKQIFFNAVENIYNGYGLTEVGAGIFSHHHPDGIPVPPESVGYPRHNIEYRIVDGVLQVKAPSLFLGYLNNPDADKAVFTEDGYYITNDLFKIDEQGFYYCIGRHDDMFISGGENIYPSEIEEVLCKHDDVEYGGVIGIEDEVKGKKPYAFVMLKAGRSFNEQSIKEFIAKNAPPYHIPKRIWLVGGFDILASGKIDKQKLYLLAKELLDERPVD